MDKLDKELYEHSSFNFSNGSLTSFIKRTRCLCQGDPLSPYLFTLVMKVFMVIVELEVSKGTMQLPKANKEISHLIFADDLMFFLQR